jgi:hypothetical protein
MMLLITYIRSAGGGVGFREIDGIILDMLSSMCLVMSRWWLDIHIFLES